MKKRFNLFYLFQEEKEQLKLSQEECAETWRILEAFFHVLKKRTPVLPTEEREGKQNGRKG